jgi:hypothetical protein
MKRISIVVCLVHAIASIDAYAQQAQNAIGKTRFIIPARQSLYTLNSKHITGLHAIQKTTTTNVNGAIVTVVEHAGYAVETTTLSGGPAGVGQVGDYTTHTVTTINGKSEAVVAKKEFKKRAAISLAADLTFEEKVISMTLTRGIDKSTDPYLNSSIYINSDDNKAKLYFKLEPGESFRYRSRAFVIGGVTLPIKARLGYPRLNIPPTLEAKVENVGIYLGRRWGVHTYSDGEFKNFNFTLAAYLGPSVVSLDSASTFGKVETAATRLGISTGLATLFSVRNFDIGFTVGKDFATGSNGTDWIYDSKVYLGIAFGYKIGLLTD